MSWFPVFMLLLGSAITVFIGAIENRRTLKRDREGSAFGNLTRPHRGRLIWPHLRHRTFFLPAIAEPLCAIRA
jgi:hypothetical protein